VSVQQSEDLRPFIDVEIASGEPALTQQAPIAYQRTSGSTGPLQGYTAHADPLTATAALATRTVSPLPCAFRGRILAVASASVEGHLDNGRPYGSASGIVAGSLPSLVRDKFVPPRQLAEIEDVAIRYLLIVRLAIARRDISYLGTANPSTLLILVRWYREHETAFINDLRHGGFFACERVPPEVWQGVRSRLVADLLRAEELQRLCEQVDNEGHQEAVQIGQLWPDLRLVVTWTCASAGVALGAWPTQLPKQMKVQELVYPPSEFMGTITIGTQPGSGLLTYDTHFFEFVERDLWDSATPRFLTMDQLRKGHDYYVLVTTPSGLYRYFINDLIRVTGIVHRMPPVEFLQKGKGITNEKLHEAQVLDAVHRIMATMGLTARFVMAQADEAVRQYRLYVEARFVTGDVAVSINTPGLAAQVDALLCRLNIEYRSKRESARLQPLAAFALHETPKCLFGRPVWRKGSAKDDSNRPRSMIVHR
jgi:hypothetical protein